MLRYSFGDIPVLFLNNEEKYLASKAGQTKLAEGIFEGFKDYYEEYRKNKQLAQGENSDKKEKEDKITQNKSASKNEESKKNNNKKQRT